MSDTRLYKLLDEIAHLPDKDIQAVYDKLGDELRDYFPEADSKGVTEISTLNRIGSVFSHTGRSTTPAALAQLQAAVDPEWLRSKISNITNFVEVFSNCANDNGQRAILDKLGKEQILKVIEGPPGPKAQEMLTASTHKSPNMYILLEICNSLTPQNVDKLLTDLGDDYLQRIFSGVTFNTLVSLQEGPDKGTKIALLLQHLHSLQVEDPTEKMTFFKGDEKLIFLQSLCPNRDFTRLADALKPGIDFEDKSKPPIQNGRELIELLNACKDSIACQTVLLTAFQDQLPLMLSASPSPTMNKLFLKNLITSLNNPELFPWDKVQNQVAAIFTSKDKDANEAKAAYVKFMDDINKEIKQTRRFSIGGSTLFGKTRVAAEPTPSPEPIPTIKPPEKP
ncbi:MAG: hypothetical protein ACYCQI_09370 [Gammaproteobacteria bacterium]